VSFGDCSIKSFDKREEGLQRARQGYGPCVEKSTLPQTPSPGTFRGRKTQQLTKGLTVKPSYRPRNKKRIAKHGFRARMKDRWGREVLSRRRKKGRKQLTVKIPSKHHGG
jgi:large subunit ribosomal protein L34